MLNGHCLTGHHCSEIAPGEHTRRTRTMARKNSERGPRGFADRSRAESETDRSGAMTTFGSIVSSKGTQRSTKVTALARSSSSVRVANYCCVAPVSQRSITPQATRAPEFPAGSVFSSSGSAWTISEVPPDRKTEFGPSFSVTTESDASREPVHQLLPRGSGNPPHGGRRDWPNRGASVRIEVRTRPT